MAFFFGAVAGLLVSFFHLWTARKIMTKKIFIFLIVTCVCGIVHFTYYYETALQAQTNVFLIIFLYGSVYCYYHITKVPRDYKLRKSTIDLFIDKSKRFKEVSHIIFSVLDEVPYGKPFDSDGSGTITNTRINEELPGYMATSVMIPNGFVPPHSHDTDKILKTIKGAWHDSYTDRWYRQGEYLYIPKRDEKNPDVYHDIKTGDEETELLTYIMPKEN